MSGEGTKVIEQENFSEEQKMTFDGLLDEINAFLNETGKDEDGVDLIQSLDGTESEKEKEIEQALSKTTDIVTQLKILKNIVIGFEERAGYINEPKVEESTQMSDSPTAFVASINNKSSISYNEPKVEESTQMSDSPTDLVTSIRNQNSFANQESPIIAEAEITPVIESNVKDALLELVDKYDYNEKKEYFGGYSGNINDTGIFESGKNGSGYLGTSGQRLSVALKFVRTSTSFRNKLLATMGNCNGSQKSNYLILLSEAKKIEAEEKKDIALNQVVENLLPFKKQGTTPEKLKARTKLLIENLKKEGCAAKNFKEAFDDLLNFNDKRLQELGQGQLSSLLAVAEMERAKEQGSVESRISGLLSKDGLKGLTSLKKGNDGEFYIENLKNFKKESGILLLRNTENKKELTKLFEELENLYEQKHNLSKKKINVDNIPGDIFTKLNNPDYSQKDALAEFKKNYLEQYIEYIKKHNIVDEELKINTAQLSKTKDSVLSQNEIVTTTLNNAVNSETKKGAVEAIEKGEEIIKKAIEEGKDPQAEFDKLKKADVEGAEKAVEESQVMYNKLVAKHAPDLWKPLDPKDFPNTDEETIKLLNSDAVKLVNQSGPIEFNAGANIPDGRLVSEAGSNYIYYGSQTGTKSLISEVANDNGKFNAVLISTDGKKIDIDISKKEKDLIDSIESASKNLFNFYDFFISAGFTDIGEYKDKMILAYGSVNISSDGDLNKGELLAFSNYILEVIYGKDAPESKNTSLSFALLRFRIFNDYGVFTKEKKHGLDSLSRLSYILKELGFTHGKVGFKTEIIRNVAKGKGLKGMWNEKFGDTNIKKID